MNLCEILRSPCFPVVLLLFLDSCSKIGFVKAMGVILQDLSKSIPIDAVDFGMTIGIFYAVGSFTTPVVSALFPRRPRFLIFFGVTIANGVTILLYYITSNIQLVTIFAVSGTGHGVVLMTCIITLDRLAGERFNLLYSLSTCGTSVGMVLLPFLAEEMLGTYGWRGVLLILGGLFLNTIPCAIAIRIPTKGDMTALDDTGLQKSNKTKNGAQPGILQGISDAQNGVDGFKEAADDGCGDSTKASCKEPLLTSSKEHDGNGSKQTSRSTKKVSLQTRLHYITSILDRISSWVRSTYLYTDPWPICISLSDAILHVVYAGWHIFLVPRAHQRGISSSKIIIITLVASIGNLTSRLIIAFLTHKLVDPVIMHLILTVLNISSLSCDVFISNFYTMLVASYCSAGSIAGRATLGPLAIRHRVPSHNIPIAISVNYIFGECGVLFGGYISGLIADRFSSYDATFKLLAVIEVFTFVFMLLPKLEKKPNIS